MDLKNIFFRIFIVVALVGIGAYAVREHLPQLWYSYGDKLDSLNGVVVYHNDKKKHDEDRNLASDGYNIGVKYQCVEFAKRYYYEYYHHEMPDPYGDARHFYDKSLKDHQFNRRRNLMQYSNPSSYKPNVGDLIILDSTKGNPFGHVAIISKVSEKKIEVIQQNVGPKHTRANFDLKHKKGLYHIQNKRVLGWLRKE
jgi:surface antigen